jgi:hypothetical protein
MKKKLQTLRVGKFRKKKISQFGTKGLKRVWERERERDNQFVEVRRVVKKGEGKERGSILGVGVWS